jgi:HSP20 family protein
MMAIVKWEPFGGLFSFRSFMPEWEALFPPISMFPSMDVFTEGQDLIIKLEVPEIRPEELSITLNDGYVLVTGGHEHEKQEGDKEYYRKERYAGSFAREIPLPKEITEEDIKANMSNGLLEIRIRDVVREVPEAKRIPIETSEELTGEVAGAASIEEAAGGETGPAAGEREGEAVKIGTSEARGE